MFRRFPFQGSSSISAQTVIDVTRPPYSATGDGTTDDAAAIQAALDAAGPANLTTAGHTVYIPGGTYRISTVLIVRRMIAVVGELSGGTTRAITRIKPDAGVTGIQVAFSNGSVTGYGAHIADIRVEPASKSGSAHGFLINAPAYLENCEAISCSGDGFRFSGSLPTDGCSTSEARNLRAFSCDGWGIQCTGGDANACLFEGGWIQNCTAGGIFDNSALGNWYSGFTVDGAGTVGLKNGDGGTVFSLFDRMYIENSLGANQIFIPGQVGPGDYGNGFSSNTTGTIFSASGTSYGGWKNVLFKQTTLSRDKEAYPIAPVGYTGQVYLWRDTVDDWDAYMGWNYSTHIGGAWPTKGWHSLGYNNTSTQQGYAIGGRFSYEQPGVPWMPRGTFLGDSAGAGNLTASRWIGVDINAPNSSHWKKIWTVGDRVLNATGAPGQPDWWYCSANCGVKNTTWAAATIYNMSHVVEPTTPNGFVYRVEGINGAIYGTSAGSEPTWPTSYGSTVTDGTGTSQITWKCRGSNVLAFANGPYTDYKLRTGANVTITTENMVFCNTRAAATQVITLPASPYDLQTVTVKDQSGEALTKNIIVGNSAHNIQDPIAGTYGANATIGTAGASYTWKYESTAGLWELV